MKLLNDVLDSLDSESHNAMFNLINGSRSLRNSLSSEKWKAWVEGALSHPLNEILQEDPFTSRSYCKPRGYSGDAELLDIIYDRQARGDVTELGQKLFSFTIESPAAQGVRDRRVRIAKELSTLANSDGRRVLSVACGHLRELELVENSKRLEIVALDQDETSLSRVTELFPDNSIETMPLSIRAMLSGRDEIGKFDFIYSSGLYDYFSHPMARGVTAGLFKLLKPNGRLLIANFAEGIRDVGYMESYMNWWLVFRTLEQMKEMAGGIKSISPEDVVVSSEKSGDIHYLELTRRCDDSL